MNTTNSERDLTKSMSKSIWVAGLLLAILGAAGIFLPGVLSLAIEIFLGLLMIAGGVLFGYYSYKFHARSSIGWLKPLILVIGGILLLAHPTSGIAAIALLLAFYFFIDAFGSFGLAYEYYPSHGWVWMSLNGIASLTIAILVVVGWPATSAIYLGIYVGISLLFDGLFLFMLGIAMKKV